MLKKILIGVGAVLLLALGVGFLLPNTITVTRTATILAPPEAIFPLVATPRQWPTWSPWNAYDPKMTITYSGPESGTGAGWAWKSASMGEGSMVMTSATAPSAIAFSLTFSGMGPPSTGAFSITPVTGGSQVEWTMTSPMGMGPIGGWFGLAFRPMLARDFGNGLASLKRKAEATAPR